MPCVFLSASISTKTPLLLPCKGRPIRPTLLVISNMSPSMNTLPGSLASYSSSSSSMSSCSIHGRGCAGKKRVRQYGQEFWPMLLGDSQVDMHEKPTWWLHGRRTACSVSSSNNPLP